MMFSGFSEEFLARYEIVDKLGSGGMGTVFLAVQRALGRKVAVKILNPSLAREDEVSLRRFFDEARITSELEHPNIIRLYEFGSDAFHYMVYEYVPGLDMEQWLVGRGGKAPWRMCCSMAVDILDALSYAHSKGVVHRDIKPHNILLAWEDAESGRPGRGAPDVVKLSDFGIAKNFEESFGTRTETGVMVGSPPYMAPEQIGGRKDLDGRVDVYAMGVLLYRALSGRFPYEGEDVEIALQAMDLSRKPLELRRIVPRVPPALASVVMDALAKDRNARIPSAAEMRRRLVEVLEGSPSGTAGAGKRHRRPVPGAMDRFSAAEVPRIRDKNEVPLPAARLRLLFVVVFLLVPLLVVSSWWIWKGDGGPLSPGGHGVRRVVLEADGAVSVVVGGCADRPPHVRLSLRDLESGMRMELDVDSSALLRRDGWHLRSGVAEGALQAGIRSSHPVELDVSEPGEAPAAGGGGGGPARTGLGFMLPGLELSSLDEAGVEFRLHWPEGEEEQEEIRGSKWTLECEVVAEGCGELRGRRTLESGTDACLVRLVPPAGETGSRVSNPWVECCSREAPLVLRVGLRSRTGDSVEMVRRVEVRTATPCSVLSTLRSRHAPLVSFLMDCVRKENFRGEEALLDMVLRFWSAFEKRSMFGRVLPGRRPKRTLGRYLQPIELHETMSSLSRCRPPLLRKVMLRMPPARVVEALNVLAALAFVCETSMYCCRYELPGGEREEGEVGVARRFHLERLRYLVPVLFRALMEHGFPAGSKHLEFVRSRGFAFEDGDLMCLLEMEGFSLFWRRLVRYRERVLEGHESFSSDVEASWYETMLRSGTAGDAGAGVVWYESEYGAALLPLLNRFVLATDDFVQLKVRRLYLSYLGSKARVLGVMEQEGSTYDLFRPIVLPRLVPGPERLDRDGDGWIRVELESNITMWNSMPLLVLQTPFGSVLVPFKSERPVAGWRHVLFPGGTVRRWTQQGVGVERARRVLRKYKGLARRTLELPASMFGDDRTSLRGRLVYFGLTADLSTVLLTTEFYPVRVTVGP